MPLLKKARSTNTPRFLDYLVTWQSEFARVPPRAPEPLNTGTLGTRLAHFELTVGQEMKYIDKRYRFEDTGLQITL